MYSGHFFWRGGIFHKIKKNREDFRGRNAGQEKKKKQKGNYLPFVSLFNIGHIGRERGKIFLDGLIYTPVKGCNKF